MRGEELEFLAQFHPKAVHFPVALLTIYPFLVIIYNFYKNEALAKGTLLILAGGLAGIVLALLSGNSALRFFVDQNLNHPKIELVKGLIETHENFATATTVLYSMIFILNFFYFVKYFIKKETTTNYMVALPKIILALSLIALYLLYVTGDLGGDLVFKHGVGTDIFR
ncbi:MAG: DUF2231 domain-containing protein [Ignavibacteriales bacterium]|nr:DUF2231 domain-containing protein [Ignavibacteriales bacterium]MBK8661730.1 DUF2231 domain-containing protein [Ignavibacteriales bacterium]